MRHALIALSAATALFAACTTVENPVTGKAERTVMDVQSEVAEGKKAHPQIVTEYGEVQDAKLQAYVAEVGQRLAKTRTPRTRLALHGTRQPRDQRLRAARRLRVRDARHHGLHAQRGRPCRCDGPRDRPRHRAPQRTARDARADGRPRRAGGDDPRRRDGRRRPGIAGIAGRGRRLRREVQPRSGAAGRQARRRVPVEGQLRPGQHGRRDPTARQSRALRRRCREGRRPHAARRRELARLASEQCAALGRHQADRHAVQGQLQRRAARALHADRRWHDLRRKPRARRRARPQLLP